MRRGHVNGASVVLCQKFFQRAFPSVLIKVNENMLCRGCINPQSSEISFIFLHTRRRPNNRFPVRYLNNPT